MKKILIIEDERLVRENLVELLTFENFQVLEATDGLRGVKLAEQEHPDLILCDVMMPILDGYGVLAQLRQNPKTAIIPFIFMTALADRMNTRKAMELGADDYITKPCSAAELMRSITVRLEKYSNMQRYYQNNQSQIVSTESPLNQLLDWDGITNLPNRLALRDRFEQILENLPSYDSGLIPIVCLSVDRFKRINDILGYESAEALLKAVGERLVKAMDNQGTVAYLTSGEFAIIGEFTGSENQVHEQAQLLRDAVAEPLLIRGHEIVIMSSMGIALYPLHGQEIDSLLKNSQIALNSSRSYGGNRCTVYRDSLQVISADSLALEADLQKAIARNELQLYYQPKVCLKTGKIVGAEALLRWNRRNNGLVPPALFIPLAEETGLIQALGEWVVKTACNQIKNWANLGLLIPVAINVSADQFNHPDFCHHLREILQSEGVDPAYLELELTESILVKNEELSIRKLKELNSLGLKIAIDDFGTGYSSLNYLNKFRFDTLKLDRCFVKDVDKNPKTQAIVKAVTMMTKQLNLKVVAEGVQTEEELAFIYDNLCDEIQGYIFSPPLTAAQFEGLLKSDPDFNLPNY
ncbi:GGDEF domain-containing response regulator [Arthrospira sp. O9.13F]|nr:GGDEF domain-containing response regulator [Arthrospira sp. O9.13F]